VSNFVAIVQTFAEVRQFIDFEKWQPFIRHLWFSKFQITTAHRVKRANVRYLANFAMIC